MLNKPYVQTHFNHFLVHENKMPSGPLKLGLFTQFVFIHRIDLFFFSPKKQNHYRRIAVEFKLQHFRKSSVYEWFKDYVDACIIFCTCNALAT